MGGSGFSSSDDARILQTLVVKVWNDGLDRLDLPGSLLSSRRSTQPVVGSAGLFAGRRAASPLARTVEGLARAGLGLIRADKVVDLAKVSVSLSTSGLEGINFFLGPSHFVLFVCVVVVFLKVVEIDSAGIL